MIPEQPTNCLMALIIHAMIYIVGWHHTIRETTILYLLIYRTAVLLVAEAMAVVQQTAATKTTTMVHVCQ